MRSWITTWRRHTKIRMIQRNGAARNEPAPPRIVPKSCRQGSYRIHLRPARKSCRIPTTDLNIASGAVIVELSGHFGAAGPKRKATEQHRRTTRNSGHGCCLALGVPSKSLLPAFVEGHLSVRKPRRLPRQLDDRLPLLAAIGEGLQQKAFIPSCNTSILIRFLGIRMNEIPKNRFPR
jgi:hypothetical protein